MGEHETEEEVDNLTKIVKESTRKRMQTMEKREKYFAEEEPKK